MKTISSPSKSAGNRGFLLIENMVAILLVSMFLFCVLGSFVISRLAEDRAKHRMQAMNKVREYMEQEIKAGYLGGYTEGDYYVTVSSPAQITFTLDDMDTASTADDLTGTIRPEPYPGTSYSIGTAPKTARYKLVGFVVEWQEKLFGGATMPISRERAGAYVAEHN
jgi:type II secretory pathway pseudopilin PulG